jgi:uncharacterized protein (TIGR02145 family)
MQVRGRLGGWALLVLAAAIAVGLAGCEDNGAGGGGGGGVSWSNNCGKDGTAGSCKTVVIGGQTWMAENLNYQTGNSWCYNDSNSYCNKYGRLYDWETAKSACPSGWHLPTRDEWGALAKVAGGTGDYGASGTAGKKLKSKSGWGNSDSYNGTDDFGFSALPGGYRGFFDGYFENAGHYGYWWTATEYYSDYAYRRYMNYDNDYVDENNYSNKGYGYSVRCVQE